MSGFTRLRFLIGASLAFVIGAATAVDALPFAAPA